MSSKLQHKLYEIMMMLHCHVVKSELTSLLHFNL